MRIPVYFQSENSECGLACLAMISSALINKDITLSVLRQKHPISSRGASLKTIIEIANSIGFVTRPIKTELEYVREVSTPAILHWDLDHFVVLEKANKNYLIIIDPAVGRKKISVQEAGKHFTGIALEFSQVNDNISLSIQDSNKKLTLRDLLREVKGSKSGILPAIISAICLELILLTSPFYIKLITDNIVPGNNKEMLFAVAIGFALLVVFQIIASLVRSWSLLYLSSTVNIQWQNNLLRRILKISVQFFRVRSLADITSRFNGASGIQRIITNNALVVVLDAVMSFVLIIMMFVFVQELIWLILASTTLVLISKSALFKRLKLLTETQIIELAKQQSHFFETIYSIQAIKIFSREAIRASQWSNYLNQATNSNVLLERLNITNQHIVQAIYGLERVASIFICAALVIDERITLGTLLAFLAYRDLLANRMTSLIEKSFEIRAVSVLVDRLKDFYHTDLEITSGQASHDMPVNAQIENIDFSYDKSGNKIIKDMSFNVETGEHVVITGPSGCGKSTLMNLMLGLDTPDCGRIKICGYDINRTAPAIWRDNVTAVLQSDILYNASIAENVSFFDSDPSTQRIQKCLRVAEMYTEIKSFPMGLNTRIGEMGANLSGGQKQRVLIARALYPNPKLLFLDEATSHVDAKCEKRILANLSKLNLTMIVIAHRIESIRAADRVIEIA